MTSYISAINSKNYKEAYKYLSSHCKYKVSYDKYEDYQEQLSKKILVRNTSYENEELLDTWLNEDGIEFKNVKKVFEKQSVKIDYGDQKVWEESEDYRYLIKEGNTYKIIWSGVFDESYSFVYSDIALQNLTKSKFRDAIECCNKALDIWNANNDAYIVKARAYYNLGEYESSKDSLEKFISLLEDEKYISKVNPSIYLEGFPNLNLSNGYTLKGLLFKQDGNYELAKEAFKYAISLNSENEDAKENLENLQYLKK